MTAQFSEDTADTIARRAEDIINSLFDEFGIDGLGDEVFYQYVNHVYSRLKEVAEEAISESIDYLDVRGKK